LQRLPALDPKYREIKLQLYFKASKIEINPSDLILLLPKFKCIKLLLLFSISAIKKAPSFYKLFFYKFNFEKFSSCLKILNNISEDLLPSPKSFN